MKILSLATILVLSSSSLIHAQGGNVETRGKGNAVVRDAGNVVNSSGNSYYNGYQNAYQNLIPRTVTQFLNDTIMVVTVTGLYNAKADNYTSTFALTQYGSTVDSATIFITDRIKRFTEQLKKLGIKPTDISIDEISQVPVFEYSIEKKLFSSTYNEIPSGYEVKKNIIIGYSDPNLMDDIMTAAAKSEIYDIVKVDYNVDNIASKYSQLRKDCLKQIKEKVEDFASMGLKFQPLQQTFTEASGAHYPLERYATYEAFNNSAVQIMNAKLDKNAKVNPAAKSTTYYYDKVPYNQFDVVINSNMIEPAVQFTYSVSIKYVMKGPDRPVGLTAPLTAKVEPPKKQGKVVKMKLPKSVDFQFDTDDDN